MDFGMSAAEIEFETLVDNVRDAHEWEDSDLGQKPTCVYDRQIVEMDPSAVDFFHA